MRLIRRLHLLSRAENLQPLRQYVKQLATEHSVCPADIEHFVLAINEACMNVIQHAYKGEENEEIVVEFWEQADALKVCIIDYAEYIDLDSIRSRELDDVRPGGLGVHLIHRVMDKVQYSHLDKTQGNLLEMYKKIAL